MAADIYILRKGDRDEFGPFSEEEVNDLRLSGQVVDEDLHTRPGMSGWEPVVQLGAVRPPPLPSTAMAQTQRAADPVIFAAQKKSAGVAVFLSFLIPGLGSFYAGNGFAGLVIFGLWAFFLLIGFLFLIPWLMCLLLWVIGMLVAANGAADANTKLAERLTGVRR